RASRMACVPMTVIGLPLLSGAGRKPVASPVSWIASLPILRAPKSVFRHVVVDLVRPGQNAALDALGIFEALLLQELHGLKRAHAALAMDIERLVWIQIRETLGQCPERNQRHAFDMRDLVFVRLAHIDDFDIEL